MHPLLLTAHVALLFLYLHAQLIAGSDLALAALSSSLRNSTLLAGIISQACKHSTIMGHSCGARADGRGRTGDLATRATRGREWRGLFIFKCHLLFDNVSDTGATSFFFLVLGSLVLVYI